MVAIKSIKLGSKSYEALREDCQTNNKIALHFAGDDKEGQIEIQIKKHSILFPEKGNEKAFKEKYREFDKKAKNSYPANQHYAFYSNAPEDIWITVFNGHLYWANEVEHLNYTDFTINDDGWLVRPVVKPWKKIDTPIARLPGIIRNLNVQRQTIVVIEENKKSELYKKIQRIITNDQSHKQPLETAKTQLLGSVKHSIKELGATEFEVLIDTILLRLGYIRDGVLGAIEKDYDGVYTDLRDETSLYVQVKTTSKKEELKDFCTLVKYLDVGKSKGLFVSFETYTEEMNITNNMNCELWDLDTVAQFTISLGLVDWLLRQIW